MKVYEFIHDILRQLKQLPMEHAFDTSLSIDSDDPQLENLILLKIQNNIAVNELGNFLNSYASNEEEMNVEVINAIKAFLKERWEFIKGTDAIYPHTPYSYANRSYMAVSEFIGNYTGEVSLNVLMPGYNFNQNYKKKTSYTMRPQDLFFLDSGKPQIIILALDKLRKEKLSNTKFSLNDNEVWRCGLHSAATSHYYRTIISGAVKEKADAARSEAVAELKSTAYRVTSTYKQSRDILLARLLSKITTQDQLIDFLANYVPKTDWDVFLHMVTNKKFFEVMFGLQCSEKLSELALRNILEKLNEAVAEAPLEKAHREEALVFCLLEAYRRHAKYSPEFKSTLGWLGNSIASVSGAYPNSVKSDACKSLKSLLLINEEIPAECIGPLSSGLLSLLKNRVHRALQPQTQVSFKKFA